MIYEKNFHIKEFISCGKCDNGYTYRRDSLGEEIAVKCNCRKKYEKQEYLRLNLYKSNISLSIIDYDISSYIGDISSENIQKIKNYVEKFPSIKGLYLWSIMNSTQKTTIAKWIAKKLIERNFTTRFILMDTLIKTLQLHNSFEKDEGSRENENFVKKLYNVDFLIVDDSFDINKVTLYKSKFQLPFLDSFLRERMETKENPICFTSNIPLQDIGKNFGKSIEELVYRNTDSFEFKDYVYKKNVNDL